MNKTTPLHHQSVKKQTKSTKIHVELQPDPLNVDQILKFAAAYRTLDATAPIACILN